MRYTVTAISLAALASTSTGCASVLYAGSPHSVERIRIVAAEPQKYRLKVDAPNGRTYSVPADGRVTVEFPEVPRECRFVVIPFHVISIGRSPGPARLEIRNDWWRVGRLDFYEVQKIPTDDDGYRKLQP